MLRGPGSAQDPCFLSEKRKERLRRRHSYILEIWGGPEWNLNVLLISNCFEVVDEFIPGNL